MHVLVPDFLYILSVVWNIPELQMRICKMGGGEASVKPVCHEELNSH